MPRSGRAGSDRAGPFDQRWPFTRPPPLQSEPCRSWGCRSTYRCPGFRPWSHPPHSAPPTAPMSPSPSATPPAATPPGSWIEHHPPTPPTHAVVQNVMIDAACAYAGGYDVILDGILGPWMLEPFRTACRQRGLDLSYIVLRPSLDVALSRATQREGRQLKDIEPITGLYGAFEDIGALENLWWIRASSPWSRPPQRPPPGCGPADSSSVRSRRSRFRRAPAEAGSAADGVNDKL